MAIQMQYTDSYGEEYASSYWKVVQFNFSEADQSGQITFYGYPSAAKKGKRIIGVKGYTLSQKEVNDYLKATPEDGTTVRNALMAKSYKLARQTLDKNTGTQEAPNLVSFFNDGIDV